jgi:hypothetical protein
MMLLYNFFHKYYLAFLSEFGLLSYEIGEGNYFLPCGVNGYLKLIKGTLIVPSHTGCVGRTDRLPM